jgi:hypothetical protein
MPESSLGVGGPNCSTWAIANVRAPLFATVLRFVPETTSRSQAPWPLAHLIAEAEPRFGLHAEAATANGDDFDHRTSRTTWLFAPRAARKLQVGVGVSAEKILLRTSFSDNRQLGWRIDQVGISLAQSLD